MISGRRRQSLSISLGGVGLLTLACAHEPDPLIERTRANYEAAAQDPQVSEHASVELYEAKQALGRLQHASRRESERAELEHRAFLAQQRVEIARIAADGAVLEARGKALTISRDQLRLKARELETHQAENRAAAAEAAVDDAREQAQLSELEAAEVRAQSAEERALSAEDELARQIEEMKGQETERGLVFTLTSGLFAVDQTVLQAGATLELDRIASFLTDHPDREVVIEGHTDGVGDSQYNFGLSERRARAVADYLTSRGISAGRIRAEGLGESRPIAPNDTAAGRQQNRRVEVVITR